MSERKTGGFTPETVVTQQWIEDVIVGNGYCPPVVWLAKESMDEQGQVDWNVLSKQVRITSYYGQSVGDGKALADEMSDEYIHFLRNAVQGTAPMSIVQILPDFKSNVRYEEFVLHMQRVTLGKLVAGEKEEGLMRDIFTMSAVTERTPAAKATLTQLVESDNELVLAYAASQIVNGAFNMAYFYGKELSTRDLDGMSEERGSVDRYRTLSRAPYYLLQVVNTIRPDDRFTVNTQRVYANNTRVALSTSPKVYEKDMLARRKNARNLR